MVKTDSGTAKFDARARLTHLLIAKSIAEALFVAAIAVGFYYTAFNPYFRGWSDHADARHIYGWVINEASPYERVEVQLYIDNRFVASRQANLSRPDVLAEGRSRDEWCGFEFDTPPLAAGEHEALVYAVHSSGGGARRTLQQIGRPLRFQIRPEEGASAP
jgi:hypothetical protein